jgi:hypothetical protein
MKITNIITQVHNTDNIIIRNVPVSSTIIEFPDHYMAIIDTGMVIVRNACAIASFSLFSNCNRW